MNLARRGRVADEAQASAEAAGAQRRPLTLVEELIVASDRATSPVTIGLVASTATQLDVDRLAEAVAAAVAAHQVVAARLTIGRHGATWLTPRDAKIEIVKVDCASESAVWDALAKACSYSFTPESEAQLRAVLARRSSGDALLLAAHHAAMDGASLAALLRLIMRHYAEVDSFAQVQDAPRPAYDPPRAAAARASSAAARPSAERAASAPGQDGVAPSREDVGRGWLPTAPARIAPDRSTGPFVTWLRRHLVVLPVDDCYGVHGVSVAVPQLRPLPHGAKPTVNDVLVAAAHLAVERWNASLRRPTATVHIRTAADLRTRTEIGRVANVSGEIMVASSAEHRRDPVRLLTDVWRQTSAGKADVGTRPQPVDALRPLCPLPPRLRILVMRAAVAASRRLLMPTATVTNLGRIDDPFADLLRAGAGVAVPEITAVHFAAFAGPPQGLMVAAAGFGDRLHLTFSHHTSMLDSRAARRFAAVYLDALHDVSRGHRHRFGREAWRQVVTEPDLEPAGLPGPPSRAPTA